MSAVSVTGGSPSSSYVCPASLSNHQLGTGPQLSSTVNYVCRFFSKLNKLDFSFQSQFGTVCQMSPLHYISRKKYLKENDIFLEDNVVIK